MTLTEMKKKVYRLIEEVNPESAALTDDPDLAEKFNDVANQILFELSRMKKIPKYAEIEVKAGDVLTFSDIEKACGYEVYQLKLVRGVGYEPKADGTVLKITQDGTAELEFYAYPERITDGTRPNAYEFELSPDALEIMPYGIAADLLKSDVSAGGGAVYAARYEAALRVLDPRSLLPTVTVEGGLEL